MVAMPSNWKIEPWTLFFPAGTPATLTY